MSEQLIESVRNNLFAIQVASLAIPSLGYEDAGNVDNFNICSRSRTFNRNGYYLLSDGLVATWTTDEFLEYRSHRLTVPKVGEGFRYHREPFSVDPQSIPSERIDALGIEEIAPVVKITDIERIKDETWDADKIGWVSLAGLQEPVTSC